MAHGAQMLADGRSVEAVMADLKKRGMMPQEITEAWTRLRDLGIGIQRERRRRIRIMGICWLSLGGVMLGALVCLIILYGTLSFLLLFGFVPMAYGIYLLRLPPTREPTIDPPQIFGRGL